VVVLMVLTCNLELIHEHLDIYLEACAMFPVIRLTASVSFLPCDAQKGAEPDPGKLLNAVEK